MTDFARVPWARFVAESVAVIASILLAFAIQAWWEERAESDLRNATFEGLLADFQSVDTTLSRLVEHNEVIVSSHNLLISLLNERAGGAVAIPDTLLLAAFATPTYNPPRTAVELAIATGRLGKLEDEPLRRLLAEWLQELDDTEEDESDATQVVEERIAPLLSSVKGFDQVLANLDDWVFGTVGDSVMRSTRLVDPTDELVGLLAVRRAHTRIAVRGLTGLVQRQRAIVAALRASGVGRR